MTTEYFSSTFTSMGSAFANHIWQSTVFAAGIGLLTIVLRKYQARIRFSLWLAASIKFLVPFSLLIAFGSLLPKPQQAAPPSRAAIYAAIDVAGQPFSIESALPVRAAVHSGSLLQHLATQLPIMLVGIWLIGAVVIVLVWCARWRQVSAIVRRASPVEHGREMRVLRRLEEATGTQQRITLRLSPNLMEPGVFGIVRPVLIWPQRLSERLDEEEMRAILAHEMAHLRRHDNLAAAIHMLVEVLFWFHPLIWWMERRMIEERERACDEAVVQSGSGAVAYAEGLLKACRFCVEAPLACVSGITGADLGRRVRAIMTIRVGHQLGYRGKLLLVVAAGMAIAGPVTFGALSSQILSAQSAAPASAGQTTSVAPVVPSYDVASIKPNKSGTNSLSIGYDADGFSATNVTVKLLLVNAYGIKEDLITGGPKWVSSAQYDVRAKITGVDGDRLKDLSRQEREAMLRHLLADRFHLKAHVETKILPVYDMVVIKGGPKFKGLTPAAEITKLSGLSSGGLRVSNSQFTGHGVPIASLAYSLSYPLHRTVIDRTGLTGKYDLSLIWAPDDSPSDSKDSSAASLFTALQEQLGLKLESAKGPVDTLVIDQIEMPSEN